MCQSVLADLKKNNHPAVNYVLDIAYLPQTIAIGDTIHAADDDASLYVSARLLELSKSRSTNINTAVLGDYLIEHDTVSSALRDLADDVKNMPKSMTYYPWVRYADDASGAGFSAFPTDKAYMAIVFGKVSTPSDNPSDYAGKWQKTLGNDGQDGANGIEGPKGDDGQTTYFHKAYANSSDGKTDFSITDPANKAYLGTCSDFTKADPTDPAKYLWQLVKGADGKDGKDGSDGLPGKDGVGIATTVVTYQASTSGTTVPSGTWSTSVPAVTKGQYLWTRTIWTYTDKSSEVGYSVAYVAKDGNSGSDGIAGKDGVGIKSTTITYTVSASGTTKPTTGWETTIPSVTAGQYLWTKMVWAYTDGTSETGYSVAQAGKTGPQGPAGNDGIAGKDGIGVKSTAITYQLGSSGTTKPTGTWSSTVPTLTKGQYLWTKTTWTYSDSTTEDGYSVSYIAKDGSSGSDGLPGKDGTGIKSTVIDYAVSSSGVTKPTTGWSASIPDVAAGQFMWTRTTWSYTDGTNETGYSVAKAGENGANGKDGKDGMPGEKGADGKTSYVHTAWAWSPDGSDRFMTEYPNENLLLNSNLADLTGKYWRDWNGATGATRFINKAGDDWPAGTPGLMKLVNPNGGQWGYAQDNIKVTKSGTYTVSALVTGSKGTKVALQHGNGSTDPWQNVEVDKPTNNHDLISYTFKVADNAETTNIYVGFGNNGKGTIWVSLIKLEEGDTATPWTPAPADNYAAAYPTYRGEYTDFTQADSTNYKDYKWVRVLGETGGEGPAGKDSHTHIAYANSADGKTDFSIADSNRDYVGMYWDYEDAASTDPTKYKWTKTKGKDGTQGIPGPVGPNGLNSQFHQAWADSSDGKTGFSTTISLGKKYLGTYTDYVPADSTDPTKYKWVELAGAIETGMRNLVYNSEYDNNAEGWDTMIGYITNAPASMYQGSLGWAVNSTGDNWAQWVQSKPYVLPNTSSTDGNNRYSASAYMKIYDDTTMGVSAGFTLAYLDKDDKRIAGYKDVLIERTSNNTNKWNYLKTENLQVPEGAVSVVLQYWTNRKTAGKVHVVITHPMLTFGPTVGAYNKDTAGQSDVNQAENNANQHTDDAINDVNSSVDNIYDVLGNKADADEFKDLQDQAQALQDSYQAFVSDGGQYQSDLSSLEDRATQLYMDLGDKLLQLSFVNTWFKAGEEGLSIGSADSSVKMLLSNNQLSFTDGGQTVAYFTAQSFYINKGAVVTSLQVNQHKLSRIDDNHTAFVFIG